MRDTYFSFKFNPIINITMKKKVALIKVCFSYFNLEFSQSSQNLAPLLIAYSPLV